MPAQFIRCKAEGVEGTALRPAAALAAGKFPLWEPVDRAEMPSTAVDGTVDEVLATVGDDPIKAAAALDAERAGKNRKGLVEPLTAIVEKAGA